MASLEKILMVGARGSRIMVIACSEKVVRTIGATSWCSLRSLLEETAWGLLVKVAIEHDQQLENEAFVTLGKEIVEKCVGVPLDIRTIASLQCTKALENDPLKNYELYKITQEEEENYISSTLKLSESSNLCEITRACLDPQIKIMARLLLLLLNQSTEQE